MGNDAAIGMAASQGNFELNVFMPVIAYNYLQSVRLLADAIVSFDERCASGITRQPREDGREPPPIAHAGDEPQPPHRLRQRRARGQEGLRRGDVAQGGLRVAGASHAQSASTRSSTPSRWCDGWGRSFSLRAFGAGVPLASGKRGRVISQGVRDGPATGGRPVPNSLTEMTLSPLPDASGTPAPKALREKRVPNQSALLASSRQPMMPWRPSRLLFTM